MSGRTTMIISKEAKIGALFFIAIAIFVVFAVAVGALPSVGRYKMTVYFDKVYGLQPGSDVWLNGTSFGTVQSIEPEEVEMHDRAVALDRSDLAGKNRVLMVKVVLSLPRAVTLYKNYTISVVDKSVIAGRAVDILVGTPDKPVYEGTIFGESADTMAAIQRRMSDALTLITSEDAVKKIRVLYDKVQDALDETTAAVKDARTTLKLLTAENSNFRLLLEDRQFGRDLIGAVADVRTVTGSLAGITAKLNNPNSLVSRLASDETLYPRLESLAKNLDEFTGMLASNRGISRMFNDEELYRNIQETVLEVKRITQVAATFMAEVEKDPQMLVIGRPSSNESWMMKQLRGSQPAGAAQPVPTDRRKLVPRD